MEDPAEVDATPKKLKKHSNSEKESNLEDKTINEVENSLPNGTGNSSRQDQSEECIVKEKGRAVKITKVSKSKQVGQLNDASKTVSQKSDPESHSKIPAPSGSPSSSSLSEDFYGFQELNDLDEQLKKKESFNRFLSSLEDIREHDGESEGQAQGKTMTAEDADGADSDSNQMEIDESNSRADSAEYSDKNDTERTRESDVDVMETDSVKSGDNPSGKTETVGVKPVMETTAAAGPDHPLKVEYCGTCSDVVDDAEEGICCDGKCERWFHLQCSGLSQIEYDELSRDENAKWACNRCSGKPPPELKPGAKPLINVRKDLTAVQTPSPKRRVGSREGKSPRIDISNPVYLKPFDYGWKRELVFRSTNDNQNKRQGDVYYYTPKGKKLRSLREISEHLIGTDLTTDNFTFWKDALGCDSEKEIIRDAKIKLTNKEPNASPAAPKKAATPKISKTPKSATPKPTATPKLTATVTPLDSTSGLPVAKASASVTPRVVLKSGKTGTISTGPKFKVTPSKATTAPGQAQKIVISKDKKKKSESEDELEMGMLPPTWDPVQKPKETKMRPMDVCSIRCLPAMGLIPTLQCVVCLCLYHPECVGLGETGQTTIHNYKCKNCQMEKPKPATGNNVKLLPPPPPLMPALSSFNNSSVPLSHMMVPPKTSLQRLMDGKLQRLMESPRCRMPLTKTTSIVGGVTTWLPPSSTIQLRSPSPGAKFSPSQKSLPPSMTAMQDSPSAQPVQTLMTTAEAHRFIVVPKHNVLSVSPATTSSVQVPDTVSTQITTAPSDPNSTLATQAYGPGGPILPKPQVSTPTFVMGTPATTTSNFQNPPGVFLVPYITPQTTPTQKESQQPQYIVVNGPSGLQPGNFIFGNIPPQQQQIKLPTVPTSQPAEPPSETTGVKRPLEAAESSPPSKRLKTDAPPTSQNLMQNLNYMYDALLHSFQYLKVQELLRASRVCHMWRDIAHHKSLWETVKMKNSQVKDWEGFAATLRRVGTRHLDLRKMLMPDKPETLRNMWSACISSLSKVNSLVKLDLCRCTSHYLEQIAALCPQLEYIAAGAIKSGALNFTNFKHCQNLTELRLKSLSGMEANNFEALENLTKLKSLSVTTVKNMNKVLEVLSKMAQLETVELGEMSNVSKETVTKAFTKLTKLRRLRLEKGGEGCPTDTILETISQLPSLVQLELINFDVKSGFEEALGRCTNIKVLLIIPTYVTQSATTNHLVIEGVSKLSKTLVHFVWGLTLELLRVTDLFIDQWEMNKNAGPKSPNQAQPKKASGDSIPILKPQQSKDGKKPKEGAVTQVDVLQLPKLHKVLTTLLPNTRIIILKVPFSATWRQTISGAAP